MTSIFEIEKPKRGGMPLFGPLHVFKALYVIREYGPIGRKGLASRLDLGEGSSRGLITHLEEHGLIQRKDEGLKIANRGTRFLNDIGFQAMAISASELTVDEYDFAIHLSGLAGAVKDGIMERDEAIKAGASGATTLLFLKGSVVLPDHFNIDEEMPMVARAIRDRFPLEDGDVVIIGTGNLPEKAEDGAFAAAAFLLMSEE